MDEMLKVEELKMYFGGLKAIDDFSMSVYDKETLGIIGPNGAGKTTLFNAICGVYKPTDGKVLLNGEEIQGKLPYEIARKGIARTFQISKPLGDLSISWPLSAYMNIQALNRFLKRAIQRRCLRGRKS